MFHSKKQPWIITLSVQIYGRFIRRFPSELQDEYGAVMLQDFRYYCRQVYGQEGIRGVLRLWPRMYSQAAHDVGAEYLSEAKRQTASRADIVRYIAQLLVASYSAMHANDIYRKELKQLRKIYVDTRRSRQPPKGE